MSDQNKYKDLVGLFQSYQSVLIAFSGGCDSALVAKVAALSLNRDKVLAVTSMSESFPKSEIEAVENFVQAHNIPHIWICTREIGNEQYSENSSNRCYFCKTELYNQLEDLKKDHSLNVMVNGAQLDDQGDWRPGLHAAKEYEVKSPLCDAGFNKSDVRELSHDLGLATWNKPAAACLSSRIPHGQGVTAQKLKQIDQGEQFIKTAGFKVVRLRHLGEGASIELGKEEVPRLMQDECLKRDLFAKIKTLGFQSVRIDPDGYRQGNMNRLEKRGMFLFHERNLSRR